MINKYITACDHLTFLWVFIFSFSVFKTNKKTSIFSNTLIENRRMSAWQVMRVNVEGMRSESIDLRLQGYSESAIQSRRETVKDSKLFCCFVV